MESSFPSLADWMLAYCIINFSTLANCMLAELEFPLSIPRKLVGGNLCTSSLDRKTWNEVLGSAFVNTLANL